MMTKEEEEEGKELSQTEFAQLVTGLQEAVNEASLNLTTTYTLSASISLGFAAITLDEDTGNATVQIKAEGTDKLKVVYGFQDVNLLANAQLGTETTLANDSVTFTSIFKDFKATLVESEEEEADDELVVTSVAFESATFSSNTINSFPGV